ncbi:MAG: hypothetical protein M3380_05885 [Chloroflexota bacterium]|nr:hypothetical protein [Chloroflexota bacterium]
MAAVVVLVGGVLTFAHWSADTMWLAPLLLLGIRPAAVAVGLAGCTASRVQKNLIGWFGIRGIGSIYYLTYAVEYGLAEPLAQRLTGIVLSLVVVSIVVHGTSVTPLMTWYERVADRGQRKHSRGERSRA